MTKPLAAGSSVPKRTTAERAKTTAEIQERLVRVAREYPTGQVEQQHRDVARIAFHLSLVIDRLPPGARVADIGGGLGLFSPGCSELGLAAVLVDDFDDPANAAIAEEVFRKVHHRRNVEVICRDVVSEGLTLPRETLDAVTSFDSMEHWHHSPKKLFRELVEALKPNGLFILGVPNCVNLRKRLTVPFGKGKWSRMEEWYEAERFRGHVREPDVGDLGYIARDLQLINHRIIGRNWLGYENKHRWVRVLMPLADRALWRLPSLCSDIYLIAQKPG